MWKSVKFNCGSKHNTVAHKDSTKSSTASHFVLMLFNLHRLWFSTQVYGGKEGTWNCIHVYRRHFPDKAYAKLQDLGGTLQVAKDIFRYFTYFHERKIWFGHHSDGNWQAMSILSINMIPYIKQFTPRLSIYTGIVNPWPWRLARLAV